MPSQIFTITKGLGQDTKGGRDRELQKRHSITNVVNILASATADKVIDGESAYQ
jgi:hypothetical protein